MNLNIENVYEQKHSANSVLYTIKTYLFQTKILHYISGGIFKINNNTKVPINLFNHPI